MSRIDYCNSLLYGVTATNLTKLQRVQNAAARLAAVVFCRMQNGLYGSGISATQCVTCAHSEIDKDKTLLIGFQNSIHCFINNDRLKLVVLILSGKLFHKYRNILKKVPLNNSVLTLLIFNLLLECGF